MARAAATTILAFTVLTLSLILIPTNSFSTKLNKRKMGISTRREKLSHLHFYFHDTVSGRSPTAVRVAGAASTNSSAAGFGAVNVMDDPLTAGPGAGSKIVGRAQGLYASADLSQTVLLMALNFAFLEGKFNGSTISVLGRNAVFSGVREMPIVGGSGVFRFARGYAEARTHFFDFKTADAVLQYDVYVLHY